MTRDEDEEVERWCALALTRLGQGAARTRELLEDKDVRWRRMAALALAQNGDPEGEKTLIAWWLRAFHPKKGTPAEPISFERARELAEAFGKIRCEDAVGPLIAGLDDVRLRPVIAKSLAQIGEDAARPALAARLQEERHLTARRALVDALVELGAGPELRRPLIRLLGLPDPLDDGLVVAMEADLLQHVGGPRKRELKRLRRFATSGVAIGMRAPDGGRGDEVRLICRARSIDGRIGTIVAGRRGRVPPENDRKSFVPAEAPEMDRTRSMELTVRPEREFHQTFDVVPASMGVSPGDHRIFVIYATQNVEVDACAVVPTSDELPPPPPEPWQPEAASP